MYVSDSQLRKIWKICGNSIALAVIKRMGIDKSLIFSDIQKIVDKEFNFSQKSNTTAYYVRQMKYCGVVKKDKDSGRYFLTRIGVQMLDVVNKFEEIIKTYDLSDCDAEGKVRIELSIEGRKL